MKVLEECNDFDVIIVGAGIVGCALARELSRYQVRVLLLEKNAEVGFGTSKANSGIVHGGHRAKSGSCKGSLEWRGNQAWDQLHRDLGFGFHRCGELTVAFNAGELEILNGLLKEGKRKGVPGLELWDQATLHAREPALNPEIIAALYAPTTGVINPYEACFALAESAVVNGVVLRTQNAVTALERGAGVWYVQAGAERFTSRYLVNAAGLYSDEIGRLAGTPLPPILPRKGEEYLLDKQCAGRVKRVIFPCPDPVSKGILVIPTFDGTIMVGPTATPVTDKTDLSTTSAGEAAVFAGAQRLVPAINPSACIAGFAGLRAVVASEDFELTVEPERGIVHLVGIQSPGLTAAPAIAMEVVDLLATCGMSVELKHDFQPALPPSVVFAALSRAEQMRLVAADARFGQVVCRCEQITEGEIAQAIARGARTLDGLKFRTRAGMGRCQGGFCTSRCMALLANAADSSLEQVTKRGEGSWLVCP